MINSLGIIQVRMGSKRLPNKALIKLGNRSLIGHMFYRAKKISNLSLIICAIPLNDENRILAFYGLQKINQSPSIGVKALSSSFKNTTLST